MKHFDGGLLPWDLIEDDIAKLYPELEPEERADATENLSRYFKVVGKIYDHLDDEGKLEDTWLRIQYEKRNRQIPGSQNELGEKDDVPTSSQVRRRRRADRSHSQNTRFLTFKEIGRPHQGGVRRIPPP